MAGIHFDITANNSPFMDSMTGIRKGVKTTMDFVEKAGGSIEDLGAVSKRVFNILDQVGKNFNVEGVENQIVALSKVIRDNEAIITQSKDKLIQWAEQAQEAQKAGDTGLFESITKDMKAELGTMQELIKETNEYKFALNEIKAVNDIYSTGEKAPMLFNTQEEFDRVERLKTGISELLSTIANFDGSEKDLQGLRLELSGMQEELRQCELNAAEAAAKLGDGGQAAAEASQKFFTLNKAVEEQTGVVAEMANKLNIAATELEKAKAGGDLSAIDDAQIKYDMLSESLQDAKMNLIGLQTEQKKVSESFKGSTMNNLRMELRQATVEIADLTIQYRSMSDEEKRSAAGRQLQDKLFDLTQKAGEMRDAIGDANAAVAAVASDTHNFDALAGGLNVISSSIGAVTGAAALFGAKEEELAEIQTKLQASLAISNALSVIQNNLQKESSLLIGVTSVQKNALIAAENLEVAAKGRNVIVTKAATVAQAALNLVAKANPYVLLAGAIISVVGALALMAKGSKEAEEAERRRKEEAEKLEEQQKHMADTLGTASGNLVAKYKVLQKQWKQLSTEQEKTKWLNNNANAFKELGLKVKGVADAENVLVQMAPQVVAALKAVAQATAYEDLYKEAITKKAKEWENRTKSTATGDTYKPVTKSEKIQPSVSTPKEWIDAGLVYGKDYTTTVIQNSLLQAYNLTKEGVDKVNKYRNDQALALRKKLEKGYDDEISFYEDRWDKAMVAAEQAKSKIPSTLLDDGGKSGSGKTDKPNTDTSKFLDEKMRQQREQAQHEKELELSTRQAQIDLMEEGTEKTLAQIKLDFDRRINEIENGYEELRQKKIDAERKLWEANPANANKPFDQTKVNVTPTAAEQQNYEVQVQANIAEYQKKIEQLSKQELQYMYDFLAEYGTMEQKRYAIIKQYDEKIANETSENRRKILEQERENALSLINAQSLAMDIDWGQSFSGIGEVLQNIAKETLTKVNAYMKSDDFKKLDASNKQAYLDLRTQLLEAGGSGSSSPLKSSTWNEISRLTNEYRDNVKAFVTAQDAHRNAVNQLIKAEEELKKAATPAAKALAQIKVDEAQQVVNTTAQTVNTTKQKKDESQQDLHDATDAATQGLNDFSTILGQITSGTLSGFATGVANLINSISGSGKKAAVSLGELGGKAGGLIGAILQIIDALGEDPNKFISDLLGRIAKVVEAILTQLLQIIVSVIQGVLNIVGGVIKGVANLFSGGSAFGSNKEEMEKRIAELATANQSLQKSIDELSDTIARSDSTNKESIDAYKRALQAEREWQKNQLEAIDARASEWSNSGHGFLGLGGEHSFNYYLPNNNWSGWKTFSKVLRENGFDRNVNSDNLWHLTPEEMKVMRDFAPAEWAALMNGSGESNPKELIDAYIERAGQMEELTSALNEKLTGYSWEGFLDSYKSLLKDLTSDTKTFADKIESLISNALLESLVNEEFRDRIKKLYNTISKYAEDGLDGAEIDEIRRINEDIANDMLKKRQALIDAGMIKIDDETQKSSSRDQSASVVAMQRITVDQADELVGRLTAIQIAIEQGKSFNSNIPALLTATETNSTHLSNIVTAFDYANNYLLDIRDFMKSIKSSVDDIKDDTYYLSKIENKL